MDFYYDDIAEGYDELHRDEQLHKLKTLWKTMIDLDMTGTTVLDVGCGTGISSGFFVEKGFDVIGIDPATKLLEKNPYQHVQGYAESLPFKDAQFDIVVSLTAIHNFTDIQKGLEEIRRVGKGLFVLTVLRKSSKLQEIDALIHELFQVALVYQEAQDTFYFCTTTF